MPKTADAVLRLPAGTGWRGGSVTVVMGDGIPEITMRNNQVEME